MQSVNNVHTHLLHSAVSLSIWLLSSPRVGTFTDFSSTFAKEASSDTWGGGGDVQKGRGGEIRQEFSTSGGAPLE